MTTGNSTAGSTPTPRFGANYTPSGNWMFEWMNLNPDNVRRDFESLAAIGLDHVRVLPLWTVLQPNPTLIRPDALDDVRAVVDIAGEFGMDASVDVLQGHLSSYDFLPAWLTTWHAANMFTDPMALAAQRDLVAHLGAQLKDAPNFLGLTLGNEVNQFAADPHPSPMRATTAEVTAWMTELLGAAKDAVPDLPHVHAEYDASFYLNHQPFHPAHAARLGDLSVIHSWVFNGTAQRYGGLSHESIHHAEYMIEIARAFAVDPSRQSWLQELGAPLNVMTEAETPEFLDRALRAAMGTQDLWGMTWWCSHNVSRKLAGFPELEYTLGLVDSENRIKPLGHRLSELIADVRATPIVPAQRTAAVEIQVDSVDIPVNRTALAPGGSLFEKWMDLSKAGANPTFVLSSDHDAHRAARGITDVATTNQSGPAGGFEQFQTTGD